MSPTVELVPTKPKRQLATPALLALLICVALITYFGIQLLRSRSDAIENATKDGRNLVDSLAQHAARTIETVDIVLGDLAERLAENGAGAEQMERIRRLMVQRAAMLPQVREFVYFDADGDGRVTSRDEPPTSARNRADRDYFMFHRATPDFAGVRIGTPTMSRTTGSESIVVSRRVNGRDGMFAGVVEAALRPGYFQHFYQGLSIGKSGSIALSTIDGRLLVREPFSAAMVAADMSATPLFRSHLPQADSGSFSVASTIDGVERTVSYRRVDGYPLVSTVALAQDDYLAQWKFDALRQAAVRGVFMAVVLTFGFRLQRQRSKGLRDQNALRAAEVRYRLLAENTSDLIMLKPSFDERSYVSPASRGILGYEPSELAVIPPNDLIHPDDFVGVREGQERLGPDCSQVTSAYRMKHADGHWVSVEGVFCWTLADDGTPVVIGSLRDVTERQRQSDALRTAVEAAERASKAKTEFLAAMSHEIRTPLNGIMGFADILLHGDAITPAQRHKVEGIQSAGSALLTVVNDVLDFSKIEAGKIELAYEPFSLRALVDNTVSIVAGSAALKNIRLSVELDAGLHDRLTGDEARLRQVLLNLLNNAIKFTRRGSVTLRISERADVEQASQITVSVTDTGIGIPVEKQGALFQRFSQVDSSIGREFGGSGLGLAITKRLVELMGGQIGVNSKPGFGSTFWLRVSLPHAAAPLEERSREILTITSRQVRILLVEDLDINQEIASTMLRDAGHAVSIASNGAEALEVVERDAFDIVLMDVHMPVMDGLEATRRIRQLGGAFVILPIIAMTANVLPDQVAELRAAGVNDLLGKPFKRSDLYATVDRWTGSSESAMRAMPGGRTPAAPVLDQDVHGTLREMIGAETVARLVGQLAEQLRTAQAMAEADDRDHLGEESHKMISPTGMLGFMRLSQACAVLESACHAEVPIVEPLRAVQSELKRALTEIDDLQRAA